MRDSEIRTRLDRIAEHIATLTQIDLAAFDATGRIFERSGRRSPVIPNAYLEARRTCHQHVGLGFPANTGADPTGRSGGHGTSPTERAALTAAEGRRDPFEIELRLADTTLRRVEADLRDLAKFVIRHLAPAADADTALRPDCASCLRVDVHTDPWRTPESVEGVPAKPLCAWCYRFALAEGQWPPVELLRRHHRGDRISTRDVHEALHRN